MVDISNVHFLFTGTSGANLVKILDSGSLIAAAYLVERADMPGSRKDISQGGGKFVYFRIVLKSSEERYGVFSKGGGTDKFYLVFPPTLLTARDDWWISGTDLNGRLPTGMAANATGQEMDKNEKTLKTLGSVNHAELGFHREVSLGDMCCILYNKGRGDHLKLVDEFKRSDAHRGCGPFVGVTPRFRLGKLPDRYTVKSPASAAAAAASAAESGAAAAASAAASSSSSSSSPAPAAVPQT